MNWPTIPIRTHVITEKDDIVELARRYTEVVAGAGESERSIRDQRPGNIQVHG